MLVVADTLVVHLTNAVHEREKQMLEVIGSIDGFGRYGMHQGEVFLHYFELFLGEVHEDCVETNQFFLYRAVKVA